jgi:hypothetical protein
MPDLGALVIGGRPLKLAPDGERLEREGERSRRCNTPEFLGERHRRLLCIGTFAPEKPVGVAIALVSRPGVAAERVSGFARLRHRVDEAVPAQQGFVESRREGHRRTVFDRPARGDHAAHADLDQFLGHTGRKVRAVITRAFGRREQLALVARGKIAAVHENELGHDPHVADFARTQERVIR